MLCRSAQASTRFRIILIFLLLGGPSTGLEDTAAQHGLTLRPEVFFSNCLLNGGAYVRHASSACNANLPINSDISVQS